MDGLGPVSKNENIQHKGYGTSISAEDDGACNVNDDSEEEVTGKDGVGVRSFAGLDVDDQYTFDSKVFLNPNGVIGNLPRRGTNDTAGSVVVW